MKVSLSSRSLQARALAVVLAVMMAFPASLLAAVKGVPEMPDPGQVPRCASISQRAKFLQLRRETLKSETDRRSKEKRRSDHQPRTDD